MKKRLGMIDILRLISVFVIFLFHSNMHIGCHYSVLTPFIQMGAIFMTAFFLFSGFSLFYVNFQKSVFRTRQSIAAFYKKRIVSIMPAYWFMVILYPVWDVLVNKGSVRNNILLAPIEFLGLQNVFHSLFSYTHNSGTWFVSCILFCYLLFPFVFHFIDGTTVKARLIGGTILAVILLYSPFLAGYMNVEGIYSNLFFRILEFVIGMLLCSVWLDVREKNWYQKFFARRSLFCAVFFLLIVLVTVLVRKNILVGNYMAYSVIGLPCFCLLVFSGAGIDTPVIHSSKLVKYAVDISYVFFFAQFFAWRITLEILQRMGYDSNIIRILLSFAICTGIAVILHEVIEKPFKRFLSKRISPKAMGKTV